MATAGGETPALASRFVPKRLPASYQQAAKAMVDFAELKTQYYRDRVIRCSREGAHPDIIDFEQQFRKALAARGYPFYAFEFYRSDERQDQLYRQGVTKAQHGQSPHNWGCAVDIIHLRKLWDLSEKEWAIIGALGKEVARKRNIKITWGGDWDFYDPAHWELRDWRSYRDAWHALGDVPEKPLKGDFERMRDYIWPKRADRRAVRAEKTARRLKENEWR